MNKKYNLKTHTHYLLPGLALLSLLPVKDALSATRVTEDFEVSGFARVVGGYLDDADLNFEGYSNELSFSEQSLIAVQGEYAITPKLTLAAQLLAHSGEDRDSGIEWLYLNYEASDQWRFKLGKLRTPFFNFSDVIDVGYAYPWITPPQQLYGAFLFSNYEGGSITYRFATEEANVDVELFAGQYDDDVFNAGEKIDVDVELMWGVIAKAQFEKLELRAAYLASDEFFADLPGISELSNTFAALGFQNNANVLSFDGSADSYQFSATYNDINYSATFEYAVIESDVYFVPKIESYYLTLAYYLGDVQLYGSYSTSNNDYDTVTNEIPFGLSPQLDTLAFTFDTVVNSAPWDFRPNMALKTEVTFLRGEEAQQSFFQILNPASTNRDATLYQVAWEWIF
jgi:hypothetical protein